jgi:hypothetical protein
MPFDFSANTADVGLALNADAASAIQTPARISS